MVPLRYRDPRRRPGGDRPRLTPVDGFGGGLTKGRKVAVIGKLRLSEWTDRNGERRSKVQVVADAVTFLGKPTKAAGPDGGVADADDEPADNPAIGAYGRQAG